MKPSIRHALYVIMRPLWRLLLRVVPREDSWERFEYRVPMRNYGLGARHDFSWYFEGESSVAVASIEQLQDWLISCQYVSDSELFREPDFWQHPTTFERLRQGDCEDHALWAWRKLIELGYDATLVSGRSLPWNPADKANQRGHVWVVFEQDGKRFVLEATAKRREGMIRTIGDAAAEYRPEFGVDCRRQRFAFNGFLQTLREREFGLDQTPSRSTA
jgi:hypothetical protein